MIRTFKQEDLKSIMDIWLNVNLEVHDFIGSSYWNDNYDSVKLMLPQSELYIYQDDESIKGFIGLQDGYIAGIFIDSNTRSQGVGRQLLTFVKEKYDVLTLDVYKENTRAISFYLKHDFKVLHESADDEGHVEYHMMWSKKKTEQ